jgi:hypothetical protein
LKYVNLVKLCVGAAQVEDLIDWQESQQWPAGRPIHVTRMWPKRQADLLEGGSLYWVFKGQILARQKVIDLQEVTGSDGIRRCAICLEPNIIRTQATPRRAFQGWRYLAPQDSPADLPQARGVETPLPADLALALADIGLL